jgi:protein-S-isoprenylcysteine O-methyltransferase Ste14
MKEKKGEHPAGDAVQLILLAVFLLIWIGDSFFLRGTTALSRHVPLLLRLSITALCLVVAIFLSRSGHVVVSGQERPSTVVSTGAFRYVRHPLYLASILFYLGLAISTASLICLALLAVIISFYNYIATYEEKLLEKRFGEDYMNYKKGTGKWLPRVG